MTRRCACVVVLVSLMATYSATAGAGWSDWLKSAEGLVGGGSEESSGAAGLSQGEIAGGLKEALEVGVRRAVKLLGRDGGFLEDPSVKIPLPDSLRQVEKGLRLAGQQKLADEFVATMNHAAERAVPETVSIFAEDIRKMTLQDARGILQGPDDAATQYFRRRSGERLASAISPIVHQATERSGVTSAYKRLLGKVGFLGQFMDPGSLDLDRYVTDRTVDGLFLKLAEEERRIRADPVARSSELLRKVFGSISR